MKKSYLIGSILFGIIIGAFGFISLYYSIILFKLIFVHTHPAIYITGGILGGLWFGIAYYIENSKPVKIKQMSRRAKRKVNVGDHNPFISSSDNEEGC